MKHFVLFEHSKDSFQHFLLISLALHISLFVGVTLKTFFLPTRIIEVPSSVRIDIVALPDKPAEAPSAPQAKPLPAAKPEPLPKPKEAPKVPESKTSLKQVKNSQKKALEKLKALQSLEKIKSEVQSQSAIDAAKAQEQALAQEQKTPQYKGNIISSGSSFTGLSRLRVNEYLENLTLSVREQWVLPQWLSGATLKAAVVIELDMRGQVVRKEIHTSSGNSVFDSSCLAAVTNASPFDPPPSEVEGALIMIRFPFE